MKNLKRILLLSVLFVCWSSASIAQSLTDGFMMAKGNLCVVGDYSRDSWKEYWEGTKLRETNYVGTLKTGRAGIMIGHGITDNILFTAALPYVWTSSTEFYNSGQKGFQDLGLGIKWKVFEKSIPDGRISIQPSISATLPVSDYVPDMMPYSIGNQSKTCTYHLLLHYMTEKNIYLSIMGGYVFRDNINIDASSYYYKDKLYYTNEVFVPNLIVYRAKIGYDVERFRIEGWLNVQNSQGGSDIRRNDKPYPFNRMSFNKAGISGKYHFQEIPNLSLTASGGYTISGRNVGKSVSYLVGVQYILKVY